MTTAFEDICKAENLVIKWKATPGILRPDAYVESWRILLWDKAFPTFLGRRAEKPFDKKSDFTNFPGAADAVKRVTYRYENATFNCCLKVVLLYPILEIGSDKVLYLDQVFQERACSERCRSR